MGVILTILKIIGIILLVLLGLIVALLLVILFVPFRYSLAAVKPENAPEGAAAQGISADIRASYLARMISFRITFSDGKLQKILKIFGIDTGKFKKEGEKKKKKPKAPKPAEPKPLSEIADPKRKKEESKAESGTEEIRIEAVPEETSPLWRIAEKIYGVLKKVFAKMRKTFEKLGAAWKKISRYLDLATDAEFGGAVSKAFHEIGVILKGFLPNKISGSLDYGSGDPAKTGQMLAIAAATIPVHKNKIALTPHFEDKVLFGDIAMRGSIYLYKVVFALVRIILNKDIQYVIKFLKNKEEQENG